MLSPLVSVVLFAASARWFFTSSTSTTSAFASQGVFLDPETVLGSVPTTSDGTFFYPDVELLKKVYNVELVRSDPPVYLFDNFVNDTEIEAIIETARPNFERSTGGLQREVGTYRTSSTSWIQPAHITAAGPKAAALLRSVEEKMARITQLPVDNQELFQVLEYQPNQFYNLHSDYIDQQQNMPCGVRVATFYLYLNDVEEGGATAFPNLDLAVSPRKGRAVLWYSSLENTSTKDARTDHEAQPVIKGAKYGANKWIHINDFITPWRKGLTG
eukprot:m.359876 g.359876  ORF g.359876 m.359876 type:complete len:272 (-) comp18784_c0_seq1:199-1014(-)